ncbi:MAG: hypothetical protein CH6_3527 [Candidatus Kapaibacterium sp.]|nr:MAG: hypothetical protein CH6_3527 [Candidatus Kapabacteria bacterium]
MKNCIKISIILLLILFTKNEMYPCNGQCSGDWNYSTTPLAADTNGCSILVHYKWRECQVGGQTIREVEITQIEKIVGGNCDNTDISALVSIAAKAVLFYSSGIFMINNPTIPYQIYLYIPSCWREAGGGLYGLTSCNEYICCTIIAKMQTVNGWPQVVEPTIQVPPNQTNCNGIVGQTCQYICDDFNIPINTPLFPWHFDYTWLCPEGCDSLYLRSTYFDLFSNHVFVSYAVRTGNCTENVVCNGQSRQFTHKHEVLNLQVVHLNTIPYSTYEYVFQGLKKSISDYLATLQNIDRHYVKVLVRPCWKPFTPNSYYTYPCTSYACCYRHFKFVKSIDGWKKDPNTNCPAIIYEPDSCNKQYCEYGCVWLYNCPDEDNPWSFCDMLNDNWDGIFRLPDFDLEEEKAMIPTEFEVQKETLTDNLSFIIQSNSSENVVFQLFDLMGNLIVSKEIKLKVGENSIQLGENIILNEGMYFYNFTNGKSINYFGRFLYIK